MLPSVVLSLALSGAVEGQQQVRYAVMQFPVLLSCGADRSMSTQVSSGSPLRDLDNKWDPCVPRHLSARLDDV